MPSWRGAHAGLLPQELLDGLSVDVRTQQWQQILTRHDVETFVAIDGASAVIGFASVGASRDAGADAATGELFSIYVRPQSWGTAVGSGLHRAAIDALTARFHDATLWVLDGNGRARVFYERHGWQLDGATRRETLSGVEVTEVRYRTLLQDRRGDIR